MRQSAYDLCPRRQQQSDGLIRSGPSSPDSDALPAEPLLLALNLGPFQSDHVSTVYPPQIVCLLIVPSASAPAPASASGPGCARILSRGSTPIPLSPLAAHKHTSSQAVKHRARDRHRHRHRHIGTLSCPAPAQPCPGATPRRPWGPQPGVPLPCWTSNLFNNIAAEYTTTPDLDY